MRRDSLGQTINGTFRSSEKLRQNNNVQFNTPVAALVALLFTQLWLRSYDGFSQMNVKF